MIKAVFPSASTAVDVQIPHHSQHRSRKNHPRSGRPDQLGTHRVATGAPGIGAGPSRPVLAAQPNGKVRTARSTKAQVDRDPVETV